jgi:flagellar protein FliJ
MSSHFRFSLAKVLELREQVEQERQRELSVELAELYARERERVRIEQLREQYQAELGRLQQGTVDINQVMQYFASLKDLARELVVCQERIVEAEALVEAARARLTVASQEKKAIEKLRERQLEAWKLEQARLETLALDEASQLRFNRRVARSHEAADSIPSRPAQE